MPLNPEFITRLLKLIQNAVSIVLLIVLFSILQYVFDMHFVCSCRPGLHWSGVLYLLLPPLILTLVANIIEPFYRRKTFSSQHFFSFVCPSICFCRYFVKLLRYISFTALWISLVFFDGDWYFCLKTNLNSNLTGMPCKENLTYAEKRIKDSYKTKSLDIGLGLCCSFLFLWSISELRRAFMSGHRCCAPYYSVMYENLLVEEVGNHLNDELQKMAKEKAETLCRPYIQSIRHHEDLEGGVNVIENISEVWKKVSASDFFMTECQRDENGDNNEERTE